MAQKTPKPSAPLLRVRSAAVAAVRRGHPWVWRDAVITGKGTSLPEVGGEARVADDRGAVLGRAIADLSSPLALRVWTPDDVPIDGEMARRRVEAAVSLRKSLFAGQDTTAYRLLHGEGDRVPGIVVDRYEDVGVLQLDGPGAEAFFPRIREAVEDVLRAAGLRTLVKRSKARGRPAEPSRLETLFGPDAPPMLTVREHGVPFVVDLARGQKTGAFLDQRENRMRVGLLAAGKKMLNLFSYAGGFSLHAALRGATVTSVDVAAGAHATALASFRAAGVDTKGHAFVTADAFAFLADAKRSGKKWEVVVSDPPSFAPNEKSVKRALSAYRALHRACADVLAPGGLLCAASCSSHVDAETFLGTLDDASLGRSDLRLLALHGAPPDHPSLPAWPEGRYLKLAVLG